MSYVCPDCDHVFHVAKAAASSSKYYVRRSSGKVLGPFPSRVVEQMIRSKQVDAECQLSTDSQEFHSVSEYQDFAALLSVEFTGKGARTTVAPDLPISASKRPRPNVQDLSLDELPVSKVDQSWDIEEYDLSSSTDSIPGLSAVKIAKPPAAAAPGFDLPAMKSKPPALPKVAKPQPQAEASEDGPLRPKSMFDLPSVKKMGPPPPSLLQAAPQIPGNLPTPSSGNLPVAQGNLSGRGDLPVLGGGNLPVAGRGNLPMPGGGNLPVPGRGNLSAGGGNLPMPGRGNLPVSSGGNLPVSSGGNLPASSGGNLPVSSGGNLPVSSGGNLPVSSGGNLPVSSGGNLPVSSGGNLPALGGANLPISGGNFQMPGSNLGEGSTPTPNAPIARFDDATPVPTAPVNLSPRLDSPSAPRLPSTAAGIVGGSTKPRLRAFDDSGFNIKDGPAHTEVLGSFMMRAEKESKNKLPVMEQSDVPFLQAGSGKHQGLPLMGKDEIPFFGGESGPKADDDLFGGDGSFDDDPLGLGGGSGGDSGGGAGGIDTFEAHDPLDIGRPSPAFDDDPLGLDEPMPSVFGNQQREQEQFEPDDIPLIGGEGRPGLASLDAERVSNYGYEEEQEQEQEDEDVFELDIPDRPKGDRVEVEPEPPAVVPQTPKGKAPRAQAKRGGLKTALIALLLVVVVVGGLYFAGVIKFGGVGDDATGTADQGSEKAQPAGESTLDTTPLLPDTFAAYQGFIAKAEADVDSIDDSRSRGLLLGAMAMMLIRYPAEAAGLEKRALEVLKDVSQDPPSKWGQFGQGAWLAYQHDPAGAEPHLASAVSHPELAYFGDLLRGVASYEKAMIAPEQRKVLLETAHTHLQRVSGSPDGGPMGSYYLGLTLEAQGKPSQATRAFKKALEKSPEHVASHLALARLFSASGKPDQAAEHFNTVIDGLKDQAAPSEMASVYQIAGRHTLGRNDLELAISQFKKALEYSPNHKEALNDLGEAYIRGARYQEGIDFFEQQFGADPQQAEVQLALVRCLLGMAANAPDPTVILSRAATLLQTGRTQHEAEPRFPYYQGILNEEADQLSEAESAFRTAIDVDPTFALAKIRLARLLSEKGTPEADLKAGELVKDVQRRDLTAEEMTELGKFFLLKGEITDGIAMLENASQQNTAWVPAHEALVEYYVSIGDSEKSTQHLDVLVRLNALTPQLSYLNARAHYQKGAYKDAIELMADVVADEPENAEYLYFLGLVYFKRESYPTAQRYFEEALAVEANHWDARFYVGRCEFEQKSYEEAVKIFRRVHDERPTNGEYHFYLGWGLEELGRLNEAMREYDLLLQRAGEDADSMFALESPLPLYRRGRLYRVRGRRSQAEADLLGALKIDATFITARAELARVKYESNKPAEAATELEQILAQTGGEMEAELFYILGMSYSSLNGYEDKAILALEEARDRGYADTGGTGMIGAIDPADIHRTLGFLYRDRKRTKEAIQELETYLVKAKDLHPTSQRDIERAILQMQ